VPRQQTFQHPTTDELIVPADVVCRQLNIGRGSLNALVRRGLPRYEREDGRGAALYSISEVRQWAARADIPTADRSSGEGLTGWTADLVRNRLLRCGRLMSGTSQRRRTLNVQAGLVGSVGAAPELTDILETAELVSNVLIGADHETRILVRGLLNGLSWQLIADHLRLSTGEAVRLRWVNNIGPTLAETFNRAALQIKDLDKVTQTAAYRQRRSPTRH
jgi:hypothetical protein